MEVQLILQNLLVNFYIGLLLMWKAYLIHLSQRRQENYGMTLVLNEVLFG